MKQEIIQLLKNFYSDRDTYAQSSQTLIDLGKEASPYEGTAEIYDYWSGKILEKMAEEKQTLITEIRETLVAETTIGEHTIKVFDDITNEL